MSSLEDLGATSDELGKHQGHVEEAEDEAVYNDPVSEVSVSNEDAQTLARQSLDFLAALALVTVYKFPFPPLYITAWQYLLENTNNERSFIQLALGLPRGFAKTTIIKIYVLYCILFTSKKFIIIICASESLAQNFLSDIMDMLNEPNIIRLFGDWKLGAEKDTQGLKKFGFRGRNIILAAIGAGTSLRGLNIKHVRPDVMIFDDIQSRECAESKAQSDALEIWMYGTAMKAKSPFGCIFIFLANMYPTEYSFLKKIKKNPNWLKFIVGGILEDFTSLWEDLQPIDQLIQEFENDLATGRPDIFYAEVLNDEDAQANQLIDLTNLPALPFNDGDIAAGKFIVIDLSTDKEKSDLAAIGYFEIHDTYPVLFEIIEGRYSPGELIRETINLAIRQNCALITVESDAFQYTMLYWFNFICNQMSIEGLQFLDIYTGGINKNQRILQMIRGYAQGDIYIHPDARPAAHLQISQFNPLKRDNDDGVLDVLAHSHKVIDLYGHLAIANTVIQQQEIDSEFSEVQTAAQNSPF